MRHASESNHSRPHTRGRLGAPALVVLGVLAPGCSSPETDGPPPPSVPRLVFTPCALRTTEPFSQPPSGPVDAAAFKGGPAPFGEWVSFADQYPELDAAMAECATLRVPTYWADPEGSQIELFLKRYPAATQPATGQLWIVEGGPGLPSTSDEHLAFLISSRIPTIDVYMLDQRGTGRSGFLECKEFDTRKCDESIPDLDAYTTTAAALDLASAIDAAADGSDVFVYGVSYGTILVQRHMVLRPEQPTAVILDSAGPVDGSAALLDVNFDAKAREILALCAADATCASKLGPDPIARAEEVIALPDSPCRLLPDARQSFGQLLRGDFFNRLLLPATIYRALRCNADDRAWLEKVAAYRAWMDGLFVAGYSSTVANNITYSELWRTDKTVSEIFAESDSLIANGGAKLLAPGADRWPTYPRDEYDGRWPDSPAPTLVLMAGLDAIAPDADVLREHYARPDQTVVELPNAQHAVFYPLSSPMVDLTAPSCGWQIMQSFLEDPSLPPDSSCIGGMMPVDFGNPPPEWLAIVGIHDLWEGPP